MEACGTPIPKPMPVLGGGFTLLDHGGDGCARSLGSDALSLSRSDGLIQHLYPIAPPTVGARISGILSGLRQNVDEGHTRKSIAIVDFSYVRPPVFG